MKNNPIHRPGLIPGLFIITIVYFLLGFVSILFGLLAVFCIGIPFVMLAYTKRKRWCQSYCPRASLLSTLGKKERWKPTPKWFREGTIKRFMLWYFGLNLLFIVGSTTRIYLGRMEPLAFLRLFIFIPLFPLPQLLPVEMAPFLLHLSYRMYSMMLSSTLMGLVLARVYRPRIWCSVCPVGTLSNKALKGVQSC